MDSLSLNAAARTERARMIARILSGLKDVVRDWRRTLAVAGPRGRLT